MALMFAFIDISHVESSENAEQLHPRPSSTIVSSQIQSVSSPRSSVLEIKYLKTLNGFALVYLPIGSLDISGISH
jgi:hypothetical protein